MKNKSLRKFIFLISTLSCFALIGCTKDIPKSIQSKSEVSKVDKLSNDTKKEVSLNLENNINKEKKLKQEDKIKTTKIVNKKDTIQNTKTSLQQSNKKDLKENNLNKDDELFYGKWVIDSVISWAHIGCYSYDEDVKHILGKILIYSKNLCEFKNNKLKNPHYKKEVVDNDMFLHMYKEPLSNLGIKKSKITLISVYEDSNYINNWFSVGSDLIVLDKNTLIIVDAGGAYFKAIRVK